LTKLRESRRHGPYIHPAGWHFSCLGGSDRVKRKILSFSHTGQAKLVPNIAKYIHDEVLYSDPRQKIKISPVNATYPKPIVDNILRWHKFIKRVHIGDKIVYYAD